MTRVRALGLAVLLGLALAAPGHTAFRGKNGSIVIEQLAPGFPGFFYGPGFAEVAPSGQIRELPRTLRDADAVRFSPDGTRALVVRDATLDVVDIRTCTQTRLSSGVAMGRGVSHAGWSPNGNRVVFSGRADGGLRLFVIDRTGANQRPLTAPPRGSWDVSPAWSPSGDSVAFVRRSNDIVRQLPRLLRVDVRTRRVRTVRAFGAEAFEVAALDWAPTGQRLSYTVAWERRNEYFERTREVHTIARDGTKNRLLRRSASNAVWSPAGDRLAYTLLRPRPDSSPATTLVTSRPDGSRARVVPTRLPSFAVEWRPRTTPVRSVCQVLRNA